MKIMTVEQIEEKAGDMGPWESMWFSVAADGSSEPKHEDVIQVEHISKKQRRTQSEKTQEAVRPDIDDIAFLAAIGVVDNREFGDFLKALAVTDVPHRKVQRTKRAYRNIERDYEKSPVGADSSSSKVGANAN